MFKNKLNNYPTDEFRKKTFERTDKEMHVYVT